MHCDADFAAPIDESEWTEGADARASGEWGDGTEPTPASDWGDSDEAVTEHPSGWDEGGAGDAGHTEGWSPDDDSATATTESTTGADPTPDSVSDYGTTAGATGDAAGTSGDAAGATGDVGAGTGAGREDGGTGSNLLQSLARIGAVLLTVVVGLVTTGTLMILTAEVIQVWIPLVLVGIVGIVTAGIVIARQDTGIDALADALYVTAAAVVGLPFVFFLLLPTGAPIGERLLLGVVFSFFGAFVGVPAFVLGWWLQPDDEEIPWT